MRGELEARIVRDLEERQKEARARKNVYLPKSPHYWYFEGQEFAFRDLAMLIRNGEYEPVKAEVTP